MHFQKGHYHSARPLTVIALTFERVATMAISDANKRLMLQFADLLDILVKALLIDSPRRNEAGGDALQKVSADVLASLALFGPGAEALRAHSGVMVALGALRDGVSNTEASRQSAVQALFQLEERKVVKPSPGVGSKHVMMSYNWDHQPIIKRIHAALVQRGYRMWIDVEQMKGSTVDAMSRAVEDSAVVLIGVSRAYKESTNCRLEAQYAMQREVDTVPLMLVGGYQADGWLGMLIGTRMWYGFYGPMLTDSAGLEGRVEELCRELGDRGRGDDVLDEQTATPQADADVGGPAEAALRVEFTALKLNELRKCALAVGVGAEKVEDALDADDPKGALVSLVVSRRLEAGAVGDLVVGLSAGGEPAAEVVTGVLECISEALDAVSAAAPRRSRKALLELIDRAESTCESIDAAWGDGVAACGGEELERLASLLARGSEVGEGTPSEKAVLIVTELLDCLDECGSVAMQAVSALQSAVGDAGGDGAVVGALELLRCLSLEHLEDVSSKEVMAAELVMGCLVPVSGAALGCQLRESGCMALFVLACRQF